MKFKTLSTSSSVLRTTFLEDRIRRPFLAGKMGARAAAFKMRRGFTLMEMLIVLSIIALLMGMVIYNLTGVNEVAQKEKVSSDLLSFKELLAAYQLETGSLPTTEQGLKALWEKPTAEPIPDQWKAMLEAEVKDPWGHSYQYRNPGKHNPDRYDVSSMGPDGLPDTDDDIGNWKSEPSK